MTDVWTRWPLERRCHLGIVCPVKALLSCPALLGGSCIYAQTPGFAGSLWPLPPPALACAVAAYPAFSRDSWHDVVMSKHTRNVENYFRVRLESVSHPAAHGLLCSPSACLALQVLADACMSADPAQRPTFAELEHAIARLRLLHPAA
jgi:hypothetical protein